MDNEVIRVLNDIVLSLDNLGPIVASLFIVVESIIPVLPLSVFIVLNVMTYGFFFGFIISYLSTLVGCVISFYISRNILRKHVYKHIKDESKTFKIMKKISNMRLSNLVIITSIPFSPAFLINISAGVSDMSFKKFLVNIVISKLFIVYFWGFIGNSIFESITDPTILLKIVLMILIGYLLSKIIDEKYGIR